MIARLFALPWQAGFEVLQPMCWEKVGNAELWHTGRDFFWPLLVLALWGYDEDIIECASPEGRDCHPCDVCQLAGSPRLVRGEELAVGPSGLVVPRRQPLLLLPCV